MTETSPVTLFSPCKMPENKIGSTGQLVKGTKARIVSLTTGENLPPHKSGELWVKGPQVIKSCFYYHNIFYDKVICGHQSLIITSYP